jgi:hypothetical protein
VALEAAGACRGLISRPDLESSLPHTMSTPDAPAPAPDAKPGRPAPPPRLPSLNQLAARINVAPSAGASPVARPRLAAALLRTNSSASVATAASGADSVAVNAASSRATSPGPGGTPMSGGAATPTASAVTPAGGEPLTEGAVEALDAASAVSGPVSTEKKIRGYKNIPSLDAITARLAKARTLSVDGSAQPPEPETIEHPKTPGVRIKAPEHPLEHPWSVRAPISPCAVLTRHRQDALPRPEGAVRAQPGASRRERGGRTAAADAAPAGERTPGRGRVARLRGRADRHRRLRHGRVLLPVLQLAQAAEQARAE